MAAGVVVTAGGVPAVAKGDSGGGGGLGGHLALLRLVIAAVHGGTRQLRWCYTSPLLECRMPMDTRNLRQDICNPIHALYKHLTHAGAEASLEQ